MSFMSVIHRFVRLAIAAVAVVVTATSVSAQRATYEIVSSFDGIALNGSFPARALIQGRDGNFYGTTLEGLFGLGTVFKIDSAGAVTTLHHFSGSDGSLPFAGVIQATDGSLYGTTFAGGDFNWGTVFRVDAAGGFTTLHHFSREDGAGPEDLVQGNDGTIFGVTRSDASNRSTLFQLNPGGGITTLHRFAPAEGFIPTSLMQASDGNLYGTTSNGGHANLGTVFKFETSGLLTILHSFNNADGASPVDLVQGRDGDFYGVTWMGLDPFQFGTIFTIDAAGTFTTLHRFDPGVNASVLIQGSDGSFYGQTRHSVFRFDPGGTPTTFGSFTGNVGTEYGTLIQASDGRFYGTRDSGGTALGGGGLIFTLDPAGTFTALHFFGRGSGPARAVAAVTESSDGRLYGTTVAGGLSDLGTVFTIDPSGAPRILHNFADRDDGRLPAAGLVQATDGLFYGTTSEGGRPNVIPFDIGAGTIFTIDSAGSLTTKFVFSTAAPQHGRAPNGLIQATDGRLYGTTNSTAFSFPLSGLFTTLTPSVATRTPH